jgi:hypothetical protein
LFFLQVVSKGIEAARPKAPKGREPGVQRCELSWFEAVQPTLTIGPDTDESGLAQ